MRKGNVGFFERLVRNRLIDCKRLCAFVLLICAGKERVMRNDKQIFAEDMLFSVLRALGVLKHRQSLSEFKSLAYLNSPDEIKFVFFEGGEDVIVADCKVMEFENVFSGTMLLEFSEDKEKLLFCFDGKKLSFSTEVGNA